jgi:hypothetical protein
MADNGRRVTTVASPDDATIDRAIARAHTRTILRHRRLRIPLVIWRDGQVVKVSAEDVPLPVPVEEVGEESWSLGLIL